jgi:hypothetical protein
VRRGRGRGGALGVVGLAVVVVLAAGACADIEVRMLGPQLPARPVGCALEVFPGGKPPFMSTDVATASVSCSERNKCVDALRKQACVVGADTIYGFTEGVESGFTHIDAKFALRVR